MATAKSFEDLQAWQAARQLTRKVYAKTARGEFSLEFGLRDQIRRASVSVMANIAEGFDRNHDPDFRLFLKYAKGSSAEVKSQLYVALDAGFLNEPEFADLYDSADSTSRLISGLAKYLRNG